jgi:hypothetical protein
MRQELLITRAKHVRQVELDLYVDRQGANMAKAAFKQLPGNLSRKGFLATLREAMRFATSKPPYHPHQHGSDRVLEMVKHYSL